MRCLPPLLTVDEYGARLVISHAVMLVSEARRHHFHQPIIDDHRVLREVFVIHPVMHLAGGSLANDERAENAVCALEPGVRVPEVSTRGAGVEPETQSRVTGAAAYANSLP